MRDDIEGIEIGKSTTLDDLVLTNVSDALQRAAMLLKYTSTDDFMTDDEAREEAIYLIQALNAILADRQNLF